MPLRQCGDRKGLICRRALFVFLSNALLLAFLIFGLLFFAFILSPSAPAKARLASDYVENLGGKVEYWHAEKMPLKVLLLEDRAVPYYKPEFKSFFLDACRDWSAASGGKIQFKFVSSEPADIVVSWTDDFESVLKGGELGETNWQYDENGLFRATIKLLTLADQGRRPISPQEIKLMSLHELGHALGIAGHSPYAGDIMVACIDFDFNAPLSSLGLSSRDKNTIARLYNDGKKLTNELSLKSNEPDAKLMRLCLRAKSLMQEGKFDAAYVMLEKALKIDPKSSQALNGLAACTYEQGLLFLRSGSYELAEKRLSRFLEICPQIGMQPSREYFRAGRALQFCRSKMNN